jgi:hypothetical protein
MFLLALTPTRAEVLHPKLPCRVFVDTDYTQIPGQRGTVWRSYARKLFTLTTREFPSRRRGSCRITSYNSALARERFE